MKYPHIPDSPDSLLAERIRSALHSALSPKCKVQKSGKFLCAIKWRGHDCQGEAENIEAALDAAIDDLVSYLSSCAIAQHKCTGEYPGRQRRR